MGYRGVAVEKIKDRGLSQSQEGDGELGVGSQKSPLFLPVHLLISSISFSDFIGRGSPNCQVSLYENY